MEENELHPLVLLSISDHATRAGGAPVVGFLLGSQAGRATEIANSFPVTVAAGGAIDRDFFLGQKALFAEVFPTLSIVGCYGLQASLAPAVAAVPTALCAAAALAGEYTEAPLVLVVAPYLAFQPTLRDLPVALFAPAHRPALTPADFTPVPYKIAVCFPSPPLCFSLSLSLLRAPYFSQWRPSGSGSSTWRTRTRGRART